MKLSKKLWLGSALIGLMTAGNIVAQDVQAEENTDWTPRQVAEIAADLVDEGYNKVSYVIQVGDTVKAVADAFEMDAKFLEDINTNSDEDIVVAGSKLIVQSNDFGEIETVVVLTADGEEYVFDYVDSRVQVVDLLAENPTTVAVESPVVEESVERTAYTPVEVYAAESSDVVAETPVVAAAPAAEVAPVAEAANLAPTPAYVTEEVIQVPAATTEEAAPAESAEEAVAPVEAAPAAEAPAETAEETVEETTAEAPEAPAVETPAERPAVTDAMSNPQNAGLQPQAAAYKEEIGASYGVKDYSLYRAGDPGDHGKGLAVDFMVYDDVAKGDAIANESVERMRKGQDSIEYVIWQQRINGDWTGYQWQQMEDRGNPTANHMDHVHVSFH